MLVCKHIHIYVILLFLIWGKMFCPRATSVSRELQARLVQVWRTFWEQKPDTAVGRDQKAGLGLVGVIEHQCGALL